MLPARSAVTLRAKAAGHAIRILRWPLSENDRAIAEREEDGLVKLIVRGGKVIGAGILGVSLVIFRQLEDAFIDRT